MIKLLTVLVIFIVLQGCSTIINGTTQKITVTSNIQGAEVSLNGSVIGRTPITARVKREKTSLLIVKKEGYSDHQQVLQTRLDPWFWGNIVIGGVLGSTTDAVSGTTHLLDPDTIFVMMEPKSGSSVSSSDSKEAEIRTFVTNSYSNLVKDINAGKGDYLRSLLVMMSIKEENKSDATVRLKSMVNLYSTVHELAEEMVKYYQKNK